MTASQNQQDVLGWIAINQDGGHPRKTLESLVKKEGTVQELLRQKVLRAYLGPCGVVRMVLETVLG